MRYTRLGILALMLCALFKAQVGYCSEQQAYYGPPYSVNCQGLFGGCIPTWDDLGKAVDWSYETVNYENRDYSLCIPPSVAWYPIPFQGPGFEVGIGVAPTCPEVDRQFTYYLDIFGSLYGYDPDKNDGDPCGCGAGDPINAATGNNYRDELDYKSEDGYLDFHRFYNSAPSVSSSYMGAHWRHSFDRSLEYNFGAPTVATILRPDGRRVVFNQTNGTWAADVDVHDTLVEQTDGSGNLIGWDYFNAAARNLEHYDATGKLTSIKDINGLVTNLNYDEYGDLSTVVGPKGRQLKFDYYDEPSDTLVSQITLPDGSKIIFDHNVFTDPNGQLTNDLSAVHYQDGATRGYLYNEPALVNNTPLHALTGIIDENEQRYATFTYSGEVALSSDLETAGANLTKFDYQFSSTQVTYPSGVQATDAFVLSWGKYLLSTVSQPCSPACGGNWESITYDASGNPFTLKDFRGNTTQETTTPTASKPSVSRRKARPCSARSKRSGTTCSVIHLNVKRWMRTAP